MHWFGGSIAEAVNLSKQQNSIFVVFVEGDNDLSVEMAATIDDTVVEKRLSDQTKFLAIKLKSGSPNYTHFAQIYQFVPVPSLFFIGRNGTPLEVVCAGVQASNLAGRIDRILEEHLKEKQPFTTPVASSVQPSTSSQSIREQTQNLLQAETTSQADPKSAPVVKEPESTSEPAAKIQKTEHHEVTSSGQEYDVVCDGDVCVRKPKVPKPGEAGPSQTEAPVVQMDTEVPSVASSASVEDKLDRAKELIDARRREKEQKEKEAEKEKELERRAQGQGVAELKRWQQEQELRHIQEERKREKMENNLARQRILEQIAQDRAERKARDQPAPNPLPSSPSPVATSGDGSGRARVQFKLPDGSSHLAHFHEDNSLAELRTYIADNLQMSSSSFSIWTAFPRRELTETEATLKQLELAPSAALLVMPRGRSTHVAAPSAISALITFFSTFFKTIVLDPSHQLYTWLRARLFTPPPTVNEGESPPPRQSPPPGLRRRGNIHRLPGDRGSDDDNNTWNGNSTQQM